MASTVEYMVTTFLQEPQQSQIVYDTWADEWTEVIERDRQSLEQILKHSDSLGHATLLTDWDSLWKLFHTQGSERNIQKKRQLTSTFDNHVSLFKEKYSKLLDEDVLNQLNFILNGLLTVERMLLGFSLISDEANSQRRHIKAVQMICEGFEIIADELPLFADWLIREPGDRAVLIEDVKGITNLNGFNEWLSQLNLRSADERKAASKYKRSILRSMKSILWDLSVIQGDELEPFVIDREVVYLDADSAEGKALKRISSLDLEEDDIDWIIEEPSDDVDMESVRERLISRGYKLSD